jgi:charged multivesicular body protein 7
MKTAVSIIVAFVCISSLHYSKADSSWNDLRVTFGLNPLSTWDFDEMPRDLHGNMKSFTLKDDQCTNGDGTFLGKRYWYKNDPATILLFDVNGYIAGIQTSVPKNASWDLSPFMLGKFVIEEADAYTMTVYFVDPSIICNGGRTNEQYASEGTGTDLYIQMGPKPLDSSNIFKVPQQEADIKDTKWGFGKCFYLMGQHYWYNISKDMDCNNMVPYCLLYNKGVLNAFCFAINNNLSSKRYEHPTPTVAQGFMDPVPDCFYATPSYQTLSTLHVYMTSNYLADTC